MKNQIIEDLKQHGNCAETARRFGYTKQRVHQIAKGQNINIRTIHHETVKYQTQSMVDQAIAEGVFGLGNIADRFGIERTTFSYRVRKYGIDVPGEKEGLLDIQGNEYNYWKVLGRGARPGFLLCQCLLCKKKVEVRRNNLIGLKTNCCRECSFQITPVTERLKGRKNGN